MNHSESTPEKWNYRNDAHSPIITRHKAAKYISPLRKPCLRKRKLNQEEWKANKRKTLRP